MPPDSLTLPPPALAATFGQPLPTGFWRLGWFGISTVLPEDWNLSFYQGNANRGALVFNDLRSPQFEIRWKTPQKIAGILCRNSAQLFRKMVDRIVARDRKANITKLTGDAIRVDRAERVTILAADATRSYELTWPNAPQHVDRIAEDFLATTLPQADATEWFWNIYGASGMVPAKAKLKQATLLPGECRLKFVHQDSGGKATTILAAHSMADRLLAGRELRTWAEQTIPPIRQNAGGIWRTYPSSAVYECHSTTRQFLRSRKLVHRVNLFHDSAGNRIQWSYRMTPH